MKEISWFTPPLGETSGYGIAAIETIKALKEKGIQVEWNGTKPLVHINFIQPEYYSGGEGQYKIGYTPWESTVVPFMWPTYMNNMQEMWTTSHFCKDIFEENGIKNVRVVPHGFDPEVFKIVDRTRADKFVFMHIGGGAHRKGAKMVAKAFVEVFGDIEDAYLLMKSTGPSEARWIDKYGYHGNIGNHPRVQVIEHDIEHEEIFKMYEFAHCCVYPTLGEGFGMIPFQAIATGLPTITTNLTGTADFADLSMPLRAGWQDGYGIHLGKWAKPDYEHLCELMLHVYNNWEEEKKKVMQSAKILHTTQTWAHIADQIIDILGDKIEQIVEGAE